MGASPNRLSWLHFSDLQISSRGSLLVQSEFRHAFERDLDAMHDETGPWDFVIITGNVVESPRRRHYEIATQILDELWLFFESLGSRPTLLVVPGPSDDDGRAGREGPFDPGHEEALAFLHNVQKRFTDFEIWRHEWEAAHRDALPRVPGHLPGEFVARVHRDQLRVGVLGFNTGLSRNPDTGLYEVVGGTLASAAGGDLRKWTGDCDAALVLSHHGPGEWTDDLPRVVSADVPIISLSSGRVTADLRDAEGANWVQGVRLREDAGKECGYGIGTIEMTDDLALVVNHRRWVPESRAFQPATGSGGHGVVVWSRATSAAPPAGVSVVAPTLTTRTADGVCRATVERGTLTMFQRDLVQWRKRLDAPPVVIELSPSGQRLLLRFAHRTEILLARTGERFSEVIVSPTSRPLATWLGESGIALNGGTGLTLFRIEGEATVPWFQPSAGRHEDITTMAASPSGRHLAYGGSGNLITISSHTSMTEFFERATTVYAPPTVLAWSPDSALVAVGYVTGIAVFTASLTQRASLEGSTAFGDQLAFTPDGALLRHTSARGARTWRVRDWTVVTESDGAESAPASAARPATRSVTAKVVLLGEGNAGKSSLALRMTQGRFEEQAATHAMKFWPVVVETLDPAHEAPPDERREVVLWDMGGQQEYRLLHRAFLGDTMAAVFVMEPRRGEAALEELDAWRHQLGGSAGAVKLLAASKLDDETCPRDRARAEALVAAGEYAAYVETSAKTGLGVAELGQAIARTLDWSSLAVTVRSGLAQRVRDYVTIRRESGRVVLSYQELEELVRQREDGAFDRREVAAVVEEMARQGLIADLRLAEGTRMLVLEIEQVERYAGSLIIAARDNPRGVPALDSATVVAPEMTFPRIPADRRLPRDQEVVILEAVITLLIEHGICFRSSGMLVFPSLFRAHDGQAPAPGTVATRFDFAGVVDKIYAALVSWLAMSHRFGAVRLWPDQAEYVSPAGLCGLRRAGTPVQRRRGEGRLEIFFANDTAPDVRRLFVAVAEDFLRRSQVEIVERAEVACSCGHQFTEEVVRARLERGQHDVQCPVDEVRVPLAPPPDPDDPGNAFGQRIRAFRTETEQKRSQVVTEAKADLAAARDDQRTAGPVRILHLSDLHIGPDADVVALLQPLLADLASVADGLGERVDYIVLSGDLTNRASAAEFARAHRFVEELFASTGVSAQRCIVVPGNHDLSWDPPVYDYVPDRNVRAADIRPHTHVKQVNGYLVRNPTLYPQRFAPFSEHFHHPLFQRPYQLDPEQQGSAVLFAEHRLQFLAFNSAWHIDDLATERSGLHPGAVARTLIDAERQVEHARAAGKLATGADPLRLAVWHHPLTGNEKMQDDAFAESLRKAGVTACLHGHIHEDRADLVGYLHPTRRLHVIGAGSFGAPAPHRPESTPQLYNLLELAPDRGSLRVHTRARRRGGGAWGPWSVWPGGGPGEQRAWYDIALR